MAVFLCATAMAGSLGIYVVGQIQIEMKIETQADKGKLLAINTAVPSLIAAVFFYISGIYYGRVKREMEMEKEDAMTKASQYKFTKDDKESVMSYGQFQFNEVQKTYTFEKGGGFSFQRQVSSSVQPVSRGLGISAHIKNRPIKVGLGTSTEEDKDGGRAVETDDHDLGMPGSAETNRHSLNSSEKMRKQKKDRTRSVEYNPNDSGYFKER